MMKNTFYTKYSECYCIKWFKIGPEWKSLILYLKKNLIYNIFFKKTSWWEHKFIFVKYYIEHKFDQIMF